MSENESATELQKQYFMSLITMMSVSAMQQLGKLKNPATGKSEVNLDAARATIDIIDTLEAKTKGNLDAEEAKMLKDTLSALKLNYVETAEMEKKKAPESTDSKEKKQDEAPEQKPQEPQKSPNADQKDPKFHKSYE